MEDVRLLVLLLRDPLEVVEATDNLDLIRLERSLHAEGASGPALAVEAVADRNDERIAVHLQTKLATVAGGFSGSHRSGT
jgi:hypothetical protein